MRKLFVLLAAAVVAVLAWTRFRRPQEAEQPWPEPETSSPLGALGGEVDPELLSILACPLDKQPVTREGNYLVCSQCGRRYPIRDGIPVMLVEEAILPERPPETAAAATSNSEGATSTSGSAAPSDATGAEQPSASEGAASSPPPGGPGKAEPAEQKGESA